MTSPTVLVVSASPLVRQLLARSLEAEGYMVLASESWPHDGPEEAEEMAVLVLDVPAGHCPWAALQALRAALSVGDVAIIVLSDPPPPARQQRQAEGVVWLAKPFSLGALFQAVGHLAAPGASRAGSCR